MRMVVAGDRLEALEAAESAPAQLWLAPGLVDLQINGYAGVDFQQDDLTLEQLLHATRRLRADGCARWLLTLMTDAWPRLVARLSHLRSLRATSAELRHSLAGWHLEGPFLSPEPGFHGAHDPAYMLDPTPAHLQELRELTGDDPVLLTLAPERRGGREAIEWAVRLGFKVSLGHTNASDQTLRSARRAGATGFTHLGNGCPRELDRHDNILWRVLGLAGRGRGPAEEALALTGSGAGLSISLIPDGIHVSPILFRLLHEWLDPAALYYTSDAMAAASAGPGRYTLGRLRPEVGLDEIVRQPGQSNYAGSALRPVEGVFRASRMLGCPWQETWRRFSEAPAQLMGWDHALRPGSLTPVCLLEVSGDGSLGSLETLVPESSASGSGPLT